MDDYDLEYNNDATDLAVIDVEEIEPEEVEPTPLETLMQFMDMDNIATELTEDEIGKISSECKKGYEDDKGSRAEWEADIDGIHKILKQANETKTYPWPGASNIQYPLILSAILQFNARAYPTLLNNNDVVKFSTFGEDPDGVKEERATRLSEALNHQLLEDMENWQGDMDQILMTLPADGCVFRKIWFDPMVEKVESEVVYALDLIVSNDAKDLKSAPRISQKFGLFPYEVRERENLEYFLEDEYRTEEDKADKDEDAVTFIEQHCRLDLDEDGYKEPYIVTFNEDDGRIVRIVANFQIGDIKADTDTGEIGMIRPNKSFVMYKFFPSVDGSFYPPGLGELLKPINNSVTTLINQLIDSGKLANTGGGFIGNGFRIKSGALRFTPGEWKKVDVGGGSMRDNIMPLPVQQPSAVLFSLLGLLIDAGKEIASIQDVMTGGGDTNAPVGTTLALIEQGTKVYSAVMKRCYRSLKEEIKLIYKLDKDFGSEEEYQELLDDPEASFDNDFNLAGYDVAPGADPAMITDMQKAAKAEFLLGQIIPPPLKNAEVWVESMTIMGIEDAEEMLAPPPEGPPIEVQLEMKKIEIEERKVAIQEKQLGIDVNTSFYDNMKTVAETGKTVAEMDAIGGGPDGIAETAIITKGLESNVRQGPGDAGPVEGGPSALPRIPPA